MINKNYGCNLAIILIISSIYRNFRVMESNQMFETFSEPVKFDQSQNPIKIKIIPPELQDVLSKNLAIQFWFKSLSPVTFPGQLLKIILNQNPATYYLLQLEDTNKTKYENKIFKESRSSVNQFTKWTRFNMDWEMIYLNESNFKLKINTYFNNNPGFEFEQTFSNLEFWKLSIFKIILGNSELSSKNINL
jgi:hypothetical protein